MANALPPPLPPTVARRVSRQTAALADPACPAPWLPAAEGWRWTYHTTDVWTNGAETLEREGVEEEAVAAWDGDVLKLRHTRDRDADDAFETRLRVTATVVADAESGAPLVRADARPAATWVWADELGHTHAASAGAYETVRTPAGVFEGCLPVTVRVHDAAGREVAARTDWYAAGVGRVQSTFRCHGPRGGGRYEETRTLVAYAPGA